MFSSAPSSRQLLSCRFLPAEDAKTKLRKHSWVYVLFPDFLCSWRTLNREVISHASPKAALYCSPHLIPSSAKAVLLLLSIHTYSTTLSPAIRYLPPLRPPIPRGILRFSPLLVYCEVHFNKRGNMDIFLTYQRYFLEDEYPGEGARGGG